MNNKHLILLALILAVSLIARVATINSEWIDVDEGNYLYDAKLLSEGAMPFQDFYMKEFLYTFIMSSYGKIFSISLIGMRFLSVIFSLVTIIFMYKIGSILYGNKIGIIAAALYAFMPFAIFWNNLVRESVLGIMLMTIAVYYLIKFTKTENFIDIGMNAIFLFLAFVTRRSMVFFLIAELLLLGYIYRNRIRFLLKSLAYAILGAGLPFFLLWAYSYATEANFLKMLGFEFSPITNAFSWQQFIGQRILLPYWLLREASYAIVPLLIVILLALKERLRWFLFGLFSILGLISAFAFEYAVLKFPERMSQYPMPPIWFYAVSLAYLAAFFAVSYKILKSGYIFERIDKIALLWLVSIIAFYAIYSRFHVVYFAEALPASIILITPFLTRLYEEKNLLSKLFFMLFIIGVALSGYFYIEYHGLNNKWSIETANDATAYVKEHTNAGDEIFTPLTFIAIMSGRGLVLNITHPLYYHFDGAGEVDVAGIPSFKTIIDYMDKNDVKYVIADDYMDVTYYSMKPDLKEYIGQNYALEKKIDGINILARKR